MSKDYSTEFINTLNGRIDSINKIINKVKSKNIKVSDDLYIRLLELECEYQRNLNDISHRLDQNS